MSIDHWLNIIWALQCQYNVDVQKIFRFAFKQEELDMMNFEDLPRKALGRKDATFENMAELAGYAKQTMEQLKRAMQH